MPPSKYKFDPNKKPRSPKRPTKPKEFLEGNQLLETWDENSASQNLDDLIAKYGSGLTLHFDYGYGYGYGYGDEFKKLRVELRGTAQTRNPHYEKQLELYEKNLIAYKADLVTHKKNLADWNTKKAKYDADEALKKEQEELALLEQLKKKYESDV